LRWRGASPPMSFVAPKRRFANCAVRLSPPSA